MNNAPQKKVFLLDTNVLIEFNIWLPVDLNRVFWTKLEDALKEGDWVLLDEVMNEINGHGAFDKWLKWQYHEGRVTAIGDQHKMRGIEINNKYQMIDQASQKSTVDTYLIAYAEDKRLVVLTREGKRVKPDELYKIPEVCQLLGVDCVRFPRPFLESIGYSNN